MKKTPRLLLLSLIFLCLYHTVKAQANFDLTRPVTATPPSPDVASLMKFVDVPVSYYTGKPEISFPLHTLSSSFAPVNITLSYDAGGIKVEQDASWVGLGWNLMAGGAISRSIIGSPDEAGTTGYRFNAAYHHLPLYTAPPTTNWIGNLTNCDQYNLSNGINDVTPDIFYVNFNGFSEKLYFDQNGSPIISPYRAWQIAGTVQSGFTITVEDGTIYKFNTIESNSSYNETEPSDNGKTIAGNSAWFLTQAISANLKDTISFSYTPVSFTTYSKNPEETWSDLLSGQSQLGCTSPIPAYSKSNTTNTVSINTYIISSIVSKLEKVVFIPASGRRDVGTGGMPYQLSEIDVYDKRANSLVKKYKFDYSYFSSPTDTSAMGRRLMLTDYKQIGINDSLTYTFGYLNPQSMPSRTSKAQDHWGFYNGQSNTTLVPAYSDGNGNTLTGADREPRAALPATGTLNLVTYPTGGTVAFNYETNDYSFVKGTPVNNNGQLVLLGGGIRVKSIVESGNPDTTKNMTRQFLYQNSSTTSSGFIMTLPLYEDYTYVPEIYSCNPPQGGTNPYKVGDLTFINRNSASMCALGSTQGSPVGYSKVTMLYGTSGQNGKEEFYYSTSPWDLTNDGYPFSPGTSYEDLRGMMLSHKIYNNNGVMLKSTLNTYNLNNTAGSPNLKWIYGAKIGALKRDPTQLGSDGCGDFPAWQYRVYMYSLYQFWPTLTSTTDSLRDLQSGNYITNTTNFTYNTTNLLMTREQQVKSNGDTLVTNYTYPQDYIGTAVYDTMRYHQIINKPVEKSVFVKNSQAYREKRNYSLWPNSNNLAAIQTVDIQNGSNPTETRYNIYNYDNLGNLLEESKTNAAHEAYQYGYNYQYLVAACKNAKANDIFYESFEDGNGNTGNGDSKTGHYSYLGAYSKALTLLDNGQYYLTYWQKSGAVWAPVSSTVTVSSNAYTISLTGQIDDVRFYPVGSLMTTYTYDPLIGVTSVTDPKGEISYYEYDSLQRLLNIRDQYKNIVKSFCYNYAGRVSNCFINQPSYTNAAQPGTFTKNNCGPGYIGSAYTYTVPAGTYTSTSQGKADSLAMADLAVNGQDNANLYGSCTQSTGFTVNNTTGTAMTVTFYGSSTYYYTFAANTYTTVQVPTATYTSMTVGVYSGPSHTFTLGTRTPVTNSIAGWSNVNISAGSSDLTLTIQ